MKAYVGFGLLICTGVFSVYQWLNYQTREVSQPVAEAEEISAPVAPPILSPAPEIPAPPPIPRIKIKAVGDTIMGTNFPEYDLPDNPDRLFRGVRNLLQGADIVLGNYESTLTNHPISEKSVNGRSIFAFRSPPEYGKALKKAGFTILSIANNHAFDFGDQGFGDTFRSIENAGMKAVGKKGQILYTEIKGVKVATIGFSFYSDHNSILDLKATNEIVRRAKQNAQVVIVTFHGGAEGTSAMRTPNETEYFYNENRGNVVLFARTAIDSGADLVLGHGPHVVRAVELYRGRLIAYSLGNFLGYRTLSTVAELGQSLVLEVELDTTGKFLAGKIHSLQLTVDGIPNPDPKGKVIALIQRLTRLDFPNTPLLIKEDGTIVVKSGVPAKITSP